MLFRSWFKHESGDLYYSKSGKEYANSELQKLEFLPKLIEDRRKILYPDKKGENDK